MKLLVDNCLKNPYIWLFAIAYFFVYVVRQGVTSWFIFYLKVSESGTCQSVNLPSGSLSSESGASLSAVCCCVQDRCCTRPLLVSDCVESQSSYERVVSCAKLHAALIRGLKWVVCGAGQGRAERRSAGVRPGAGWTAGFPVSRSHL